MILVNEQQGYRVCLECHERLDGSDEYVWMARHAACNQDGPEVPGA